MAPEPEQPKHKPAAPAPPPPPPPLPPMDLPPPPAQAAAAGDDKGAQLSSSKPGQPAPQSAPTQPMEDDDLIEKEWVNKAKQIVNKNRSDPYKQSEELTAFRADYMKKRYGKNIKLDK